MVEIKLKSENFKVTEIIKKTQAEGFKGLEVGDILEFEMKVESTKGASGGGQYASYVLIRNLTKKTSAWKSQNQLLGFLKTNFSIEKCE